jgi:hypothetical protein
VPDAPAVKLPIGVGRLGPRLQPEPEQQRREPPELLFGLSAEFVVDAESAFYAPVLVFFRAGALRGFPPSTSSRPAAL